MNNKKIRAVGAAVLVALWLVLTGFAWFGPAQDFSESERRPLDQWPGISWKTLMSGKFMADFEDYTLDQFPMRDSFRQLKSLTHYYALNQKDNNGIYLTNGYAAKLEYPYKPQNVAHALGKFQYLYDHYLKDSGSKIYTAVVPDKGYYLAKPNGYLAMDYNAMFRDVAEGMPWATYVDLTDTLDLEDYYFTDTHWRQEKILDAAAKLAQAMGIEPPSITDFKQIQLDRPFYGVYYGQAALPMKSEPLHYLENEVLNNCTVKNFENNKVGPVYDLDKAHGKDPYELFLSGPISLLTITNPNAATDKELIIFRDSFGSSMAPLLAGDYKTVTLVDIRYLSSAMLGRFIDFHGQDVLFLYSTLVLNNGDTLK